jgi:hypothetical protein
VSRHHILRPVIYSPPPPKPKETKRKRGVAYASATEATGEAEETGEASETPQARAAAALPQHQRPVEAADRHIPSPNGKLSDGTLKAMLEVQEEENALDASFKTHGGDALK